MKTLVKYESVSVKKALALAKAKSWKVERRKARKDKRVCQQLAIS